MRNALGQFLHLGDAISGFFVRALHAAEDCLVREDVVELRLSEVCLDIAQQRVKVVLHIGGQRVVPIDR